MRIVIDMQGAQTESRFRGIGRYTMSLVQAIVRNRGEHEIILALSGLFPETIESIRADFDGLLPQSNIRVWYAPGLVRECESGNYWRREVAEHIREAFLASLRPDVLHVSSLFEGYTDDAVTSIGIFAPQIPAVITLYDLIPLLNSKAYLDPHPDFARHYQRKIEYLKRANKWLAISESAAVEGRVALSLPSDSVINISAACDDVFRPNNISESEKQQLFERFNISNMFILYSGGSDARKNLHRLIRAYIRLPKKLLDKSQLVLMGKMPGRVINELKQITKSFGVFPDRLLFTGYVTDEDLVRLYNLCTVFVFPSYHEGFGLPVLEAMSCGAAVIGANTSSVPEVIGNQNALFDPYDEEVICQKIVQVLGDAAFRSELAARGLEQARKFSWDESARRAIAAYEKLYSVRDINSKFDEPENMLSRLVHTIAELIPFSISDKEMFNIAHMLNFNHVANASRQIFVDISELIQRDAGTGIQRVTRSILKELLESPPDGYVVEPVYSTANSYGYRYARGFIARFRGETNDSEDEPIDYQYGDIFLGLDLQHHVVMAQKNYLATLRRDGVKVFFVVYDLLPVLMPNAFPSNDSIDHKVWLEIIMGFDGALCISRAVADELTTWHRNYGPQRLRSFKIAWFHLGSDVINSVPTCGLPDNANNVLKELSRRATFLTVGTVEPRKGHTQILGAFELLWRKGIDANLVIIGRQGWMVELLADQLRKHSEWNKRLFWLEGISDEYLEKIYAASTCLIAASEGEGFGLPLIEAARHKLPIIARDIPVFREVIGEHGFYFKGLDPQALEDAIRRWLELDGQGQSPQSDNMPWLTWKQSAEWLKQIIIEGDQRSSRQELTDCNLM